MLSLDTQLGPRTRCTNSEHGLSLEMKYPSLLGSPSTCKYFLAGMMPSDLHNMASPHVFCNFAGQVILSAVSRKSELRARHCQRSHVRIISARKSFVPAFFRLFSWAKEGVGRVHQYLLLYNVGVVWSGRRSGSKCCRSGWAYFDKFVLCFYGSLAQLCCMARQQLQFLWALSFVFSVEHYIIWTVMRCETHSGTCWRYTLGLGAIFLAFWRAAVQRVLTRFFLYSLVLIRFCQKIPTLCWLLFKYCLFYCWFSQVPLLGTRRYKTGQKKMLNHGWRNKGHFLKKLKYLKVCKLCSEMYVAVIKLVQSVGFLLKIHLR